MARPKSGTAKRNRSNDRSATAPLPSRGEAATVKAGATTFGTTEPIEAGPASSRVPTVTMTWGSINGKLS